MNVCVFYDFVAISVDVTIMVDTLTRVLDIAPYNNVSLTCVSSITVNTERTPFNVTFAWFRTVNGRTMEQLIPQFASRGYGSTVMNKLSVSAQEAGTHNYICRVTLDLKPAPDQRTEQNNVVVTVNGELRTDFYM